MGKKQIAVLDKMKPKFISQAKDNGHDPKKLEKFGLIGKHLRAMPLTKSFYLLRLDSIPNGIS